MICCSQILNGFLRLLEPLYFIWRWHKLAFLPVCVQVRSAVRKRWIRWQDRSSFRSRAVRATSIPTSPSRVSFHSIKQSSNLWHLIQSQAVMSFQSLWDRTWLKLLMDQIRLVNHSAGHRFVEQIRGSLCLTPPLFMWWPITGLDQSAAYTKSQTVVMSSSWRCSWSVIKFIYWLAIYELYLSLL